MKIEVLGSKTDSGRSRDNNQDRYFIDEKMGLFIIADGMGGHQAGEVASEIAVNTIAYFLIKNSKANNSIIYQTIQQAFQEANNKIYTCATSDPDLNGMCTTAVVALYYKNRILIAHVGDSRAYLIRSGRLKRLTQDHSLVEELLRQGDLTAEESRNHHLRHVVTKVLGSEQPVEPEIISMALIEGDFLLLCTDGLTDMVTDEEIRDIILKNDKLGAICDGLVSSANEKGGKDNITVLLIRFE